MADDFGDYSGEKLFDWILRMGQDAGGSAAMAAADKLKAALDNASRGAGALDHDGADMEAGGREPGGPAQWAKLDMHEFTSVEDYLKKQSRFANFDAHDFERVIADRDATWNRIRNDWNK